MDIISTRGPYTHLWWCTAGEGDPANSTTHSSCLQPGTTSHLFTLLWTQRFFFFNKTMVRVAARGWGAPAPSVCCTPPCRSWRLETGSQISLCW